MFSYFRTILLMAGLAVAMAVLTHDPQCIEARAPATRFQATIRIEGATHTLFAGAVVNAGPRNITTESGGTHVCNGENNGANPQRDPTCITALDQASKRGNFTYDGTWDNKIQDFFITRIGNSSETRTKFWGLLVNGQFTKKGGCETEVDQYDRILWAYDAFNAKYFLHLAINEMVLYADQPFNATVTDLMTGNPVQGASVNGSISDANGMAKLKTSHGGTFTYKAFMKGSIRSNALSVYING